MKQREAKQRKERELNTRHVHWVADVHLAGFAIALSLGDSFAHANRQCP